MMKKAILAAVAAFGLAAGAHAGLEISDGFAYPDGNLVGGIPAVGGPWAAHSGAGVTPVLVSGGAISLAQGAGTREDVNAPFANGPMAAGDVYYAAFDLTIADPGAAITSGYFAHFLETTTTFGGRLWITAPTTSGYRLAISNDASITDADGEAFTSDLAFGTTYRVISSYNHDAGTGSLWIDPTDLSSSSISATDPGFVDEMFAYGFRQAGGNTVQVIDNLAVGTTFNDVVPEPTMLGLVGLAALALVSRRRD